MVLVDSMHEEQDLRLPAYGTAGMQVVRQFRLLALLRTTGILALYRQQIPNPGLQEESFAQYAAILTTTNYFEASNAERLALVTSLAESRAAGVLRLGDLPLFVISRALAMPVPGLTEAENRQNEAIWSEMQRELTALSSSSRQLMAEGNGHNIHLQEPDLVVEAIRQIATEAAVSTSATPIAEKDAAEPAQPPSRKTPAALPSITPSPEPSATPPPSQRRRGPWRNWPSPSSPGSKPEGFFMSACEEISTASCILIWLSPREPLSGLLWSTATASLTTCSFPISMPSQPPSAGKKSAEVTSTLGAELSGILIYYCTFPGHRAAGQEGWLIVAPQD